MLVFLRSVWTWGVSGLLILLWVPVMGVSYVFDRDPVRYRTGYLMRKLGHLMTIVNPMWKIEILGAFPENPRLPYVVVSNHQSNADIPVISRVPWEMKWVGKASLFKLPVVGWMMRWSADIPVDRKDRLSRAKVLVHARSVLDHRCSVMFFPEGTRSRTGLLLPFADGPFRLAIQAGVPILPMVVEGTQNALPKNTWKLGESSTIRLEVLPPVSVEGLAPEDASALREQVRRTIAARLAEWRGVAIADVLEGGEESTKPEVPQA